MRTATWLRFFLETAAGPARSTPVKRRKEGSVSQKEGVTKVLPMDERPFFLEARKRIVQVKILGMGV